MSVNFDIQNSQVNSRPPICRICTGGEKPRIQLVQAGKGVRHWPNEGHINNQTPEQLESNNQVGKQLRGGKRKGSGRKRQ